MTRTILIVEDNLDLLAVLSNLLGHDYAVVTANRGEEAIEKARKHEPDLVILDMQLPAMDGIETGRWIKQVLAPRKVPILALTALAGAGDADAIIESGCCDGYLAKPSTLETIRARVEELLDTASDRAA